MPNPLEQNSPFNIARIIIIVGFVVVAYMLYNLTVSIYENYQIDSHIEDFQEKNTELETENLDKIESYQYYTSDKYIEKIAKQNLGLVNEGEKVIVITVDGENQISEEKYQESQTLAMRNSWSNPHKWWEFFFGENPFKY